MVRCKLWRPGDDPDVRDIEDFRWHGEALPAELDPHTGVTLNPSGRMLSDAEFELAMASRKAGWKKMTLPSILCSALRRDLGNRLPLNDEGGIKKCEN